MNGSVLLLDDDHNVTKALFRELRSHGYCIFIANTGVDALNILKKETIDVIITDQKMPNMSGSEFLEKAIKIQPKVVPIMISGFANFENLVHAINCGTLFHFISKPWDKKQLQKLVKEGVSRAINNRLSQLPKNNEIDDVIDPFLVLTLDGTIKRVNETFSQLVGLKKDQITGKNLIELIRFNKNHRSFCSILESTKLTGKWSGAVHIIDRKGDSNSIALTLRKHKTDSDGDIEFVASIKENRELEILKGELNKLATQDMASGALNRTAFTNLLNYKIASLEKHQQLALAIIQIPKIEEIRLTIGETTFKSLCFKLMLRIKNLSSNENNIGRISEDKFAVVSKAFSVDSYLMNFIEELSSLFIQSFDISNHCVPIIPEIGFCIYPDEADTAEKMLMSSFTALNLVRQQRESESPSERNKQNLFYREYLVNRDLARAIENKALTVEYQPIINACLGRVIGMESLIRWYDNGKQIISPENLINHADEALLQTSKLHAEGLDISVSINASAIELNDSKYFNRLSEKASCYGVDPHKIIIEITETALLTQSTEVITNIKNLREIGIKIYLDDFGTGFTSFKSISEFSVDGFKIDKSFVQGCELDKTKRELIRCLIELASALELNLIAEGVETTKQFEYLFSQKEDLLLQGFLFARPMSATAISEYIQNSQRIVGD
jgi:PAS domain S-box-containing protein